MIVKLKLIFIVVVEMNWCCFFVDDIVVKCKFLSDDLLVKEMEVVK